MVKRAPARKRPRKAKPGTKGSEPGRMPTGSADGSCSGRWRRQSPKLAAALLDRTRSRLAVIRYCLSVLPIDVVEPTPFQRDLSDAHHKRLADVINKTGRFLDPIIAVVAPKRRILDSQRPASPRSHAPPWGEIHHCARRG